MRVTVIITTYKNATSLRRCLLGFTRQTYHDFDILIAEDGPADQTRSVLGDELFRDLRMRHLWHADNGFRKNLLLNRAIAVCESEYIIFCDGDCIPRDDFVATHLSMARPRRYVSGVRIGVPREVHPLFQDADILEGRVFEPEFLLPRHPRLRNCANRLTRNPNKARWLDLLTYRAFLFHGSNASAWRADLLKVNGFDESFVWGSDDRDIGARLKNAGVRSRFGKYSLVQLHLNHLQPYREKAAARRNRNVFRRRLLGIDRTTFIEPGIDTSMQRSDLPVLETVSREVTKVRCAG